MHESSYSSKHDHRNQKKYMYIYIIYLYIYVYIYIIYIYEYTFICIHIYTHKYTQTHTHTLWPCYFLCIMHHEHDWSMPYFEVSNKHSWWDRFASFSNWMLSHTHPLYTCASASSWILNASDEHIKYCQMNISNSKRATLTFTPIQWNQNTEPVQMPTAKRQLLEKRRLLQPPQIGGTFSDLMGIPVPCST